MQRLDMSCALVRDIFEPRARHLSELVESGVDQALGGAHADDEGVVVGFLAGLGDSNEGHVFRNESGTDDSGTK